MLSILFAAATAVVWGASDYCGGRATRTGDALGVTVASQLFSLPVLGCCLLLIPGVVHAGDLGWGAAAGVAGFLGIVLLYRGLASGAMAVVAPITAVTSAVVPLVVGLVIDRLPSVLALFGAVLAVLAIGLVSLGSAGPTRIATPRLVGLALSSGVMFGLFLALLAQVHDDSGVWPLVGVRVASVPLGLALLVLRRGRRAHGAHGARGSWRGWLDGKVLGWSAAAGMGDIAANAFFIFASRDALLSVVGPVAALYPVSTVLLALFVDKERVRVAQVAGLSLAAAALVLTAV